MKKLTVHGVALNLLDEGQGRPVVFVHGFPLDGRMWDAQRAAFNSSCRVIIPDLCGFGQSRNDSFTEEKLTMTRLADDCAEILNQLEIAEPVMFCGLSMGGYIAWEFARWHREKLAGLIVCDSRALPDTAETVNTRKKSADELRANGSEQLIAAMSLKLFSQQTIQNKPEVIEAVKTQMKQADPLAMAAAQFGMAERFDATELLPELDVPALLLGGEDDIISPPTEMSEIATAMPNAQFVEIPQAGHMAPMENPEAVNTAISGFLDQMG